MTTDSVVRILKGFDGHYLHSRPADRYSNLSTFECSCGQVFVPGPAWPELPRKYPTMAHIHHAEGIALELGMLADRPRVDSLRGLLDLPTFTVIRDANGLMLRRFEFAENKLSTRWFSQDGQTLTAIEITLPARVWWTPPTPEVPAG